MDIHEKHESDLTREEKRFLEREKIQKLQGAQKWEYILTYYKFHILGVVLAVALIFGGISWYKKAKIKTVLYTVVMNTTIDSKGKEALGENFLKEIGENSPYKKMIIDTSLFVSPKDGEMDYNSTMKLSTLLGAATVDVMIAPPALMDKYLEQDGFVPLEKILPRAEYEKVKGTVRQDCCLSLKNNQWMEERFGTQIGEMEVAVLYNSKHHKMAAKFLTYLLRQGK